MPLGDLIAEAAHRVFVEILGALLEIPVRGLGYFIIKYGFYLGQRGVDWESHTVLIVGFLAWLVVGVVGYMLWNAYQAV